MNQPSIIHRSNGIDGKLPFTKWIVIGDNTLGIICFSNRAPMEFEMTVFPGLNEDGSLAVKSHHQHTPGGLLFLGTEYRLGIDCLLHRNPTPAARKQSLLVRVPFLSL